MVHQMIKCYHVYVIFYSYSTLLSYRDETDPKCPYSARYKL